MPSPPGVLRLLRTIPSRERVAWATVGDKRGRLALGKTLVLIALGVSASLLMGCSARLHQCDPANVPGSNCYTTPGPPYRN
jgi:hypothetical protein